MARKQRKNRSEGLNEANITPLADVTTTLMLVFLITMPALMWSGFDVNQAETGGESPQVQPTDKLDDDLLTIAVTEAGLKLNGKLLSDEGLAEAMTRELAGRQDRTVVIVPEDQVILGRVVTALDIAKASGAENLALLNRIGG
ncbi:MAG: biopolymer transporter ExbD [Candidatus Krumholzibacteria bacterium]|jgi:biopolymer transport protein ExbD|nr:biopolymer transporter ExbD [Candidatus Krumholzibacteria bacterium]